MTVQEVSVHMVFDNKGIPVAIIPNGGRAITFSTEEMRPKELADLMKDMCDAEPNNIKQ